MALTNEMIADLFAANLAPAGKSDNGTFWFANGVLYSYGLHFPIAVWADDRTNAVYFTDRDYSVTTARHKALAVRALKRAGVDVIVTRGLATLAEQKRSLSHRPVTHSRDVFVAA